MAVSSIPDESRIADRLARLAGDAGFAAAGIAAVPAPGSPEDKEERSRFADWIDRGRAGTMEYLKRRDEEGRLVRGSVRVALPWARSVIVCAANYDSGGPNSIDPAPPGTGWIARYAITGQTEIAGTGLGDGGTRPSDYHKVLLRRLETLRGWLIAEIGPFESRCFVDTGPVVERVYARYAGLGWVGKNTCLLNEDLGSWLFLGVIVTSIELTAESGLAGLAADRCGSCTRCIDACPTQALTPYQMDATRCIAYLTIEHRGAIAEEIRSGMGRQIFGCDICQEVCPWNERARRAADKRRDRELAPRPELMNPALDWLAAMDEGEFGRWFNGSPVRRAKFSGLRRNLAIAMGNSGQQRYLPLLEKWATDTDGDTGPVVADAARWAVDQLRRNLE